MDLPPPAGKPDVRQSDTDALLARSTPGATVSTRNPTDVDDDLLEKACTTLGTGTVNDTVNTALADVVRAPSRRRHADRLARMQRLDMAERDVMADAWRR